MQILLRTSFPLPSKLKRARLWHKHSLEVVQRQPRSEPADKDQTEMDSERNGKIHGLEYTHPRRAPPVPSVWVLYKVVPRSGAKPLRAIWEHLVQPWTGLCLCWLFPWTLC